MRLSKQFLVKYIYVPEMRVILNDILPSCSEHYNDEWTNTDTQTHSDSVPVTKPDLPGLVCLLADALTHEFVDGVVG